MFLQPLCFNAFLYTGFAISMAKLKTWSLEVLFDNISAIVGS